MTHSTSPEQSLDRQNAFLKPYLKERQPELEATIHQLLYGETPSQADVLEGWRTDITTDINLREGILVHIAEPEQSEKRIVREQAAVLRYQLMSPYYPKI